MINQYVQYGCGPCAPKTWRNFDVSPTLRLQKLPIIGSRMRHGTNPLFSSHVEYGDIVSGLPLASGSCKAIYCAHVLEHLALDGLRRALKNTHTYLEPGGVFRFVLPDLELLARNYLASEDAFAALIFMEEAHLGKKERPKGLKALLFALLGNSSHLWMWDFKSMKAELEKTGFQNIRRAAFGDSQDPRFDDVEELKRWEGCLGMECYR